MERRTSYTNVFASKIIVPRTADDRPEEETPPVEWWKVEMAVRNAKANRAPGPDGITNEVLKAGSHPLWKALATLFTNCLDQEQVPAKWKESATILIVKKGDRQKPRNYRPITLLPTVYKLFTKMLVNRLARQLDDEQPREQAGFRSEYSTADHLQVVNQVLKRTRELRTPLCLVFVDYEKAFDIVETTAVTNALIRQNIPKKYIRTLENVCRGCTTTIRLFQAELTIQIARGVRQGDTISPKLFTVPHLRTLFDASTGTTEAYE